MESPTIVPLIHRLVALGLVERITTASDKRKRLLVVTDKGKALYEQVKTVADDLREEIPDGDYPTGAGANPAGAGKAVARSGEEIMPRRPGITPYAPHDWAPHEKPALLGSPSTRRCTVRRNALPTAWSVCWYVSPARWATQWSPPTCSCCRVPSPPGRRWKSLWLPAGIRDDQRLHQPAAGEIPPAVWPARFHPKAFWCSMCWSPFSTSSSTISAQR